MPFSRIALLSACILCLATTLANAQQVFPQAPPLLGNPNGLRPIQGAAPGTGTMVPLYPSPSTSVGGGYDPFARPNTLPATPTFGAGNVAPSLPGNFGGVAPGVGLAPPVVGGQSATVGTFQNNPTTYGAPGIYPSNTPSAMFPGGVYPNGYQPSSGNPFSRFWNGLFGRRPSTYTLPQPPTLAQGGAPVQLPNFGAWNPQGSVFTGTGTPPGFIRFFQGPRFRHAFVYGNNDPDALMINDSDVALAFAWPNFLFTTQPLFLMPSFSLHQWDGPHPPSTADLPPVAYSAFLDAGWQSDPARILGAEVGLRVGMFSDFDTANSDSLRIMGRGIGRVRITPRAILKGGVIYLDRNKVKLLPAGGLLWYPNENTRLDLFFPEPKLASYLTTIGNTDTWWYAGGYYGGGSWTIERADTSKDSIDINDLRIVFGLEFGRNELMREGRRMGFVEVGYVFDRELLYDATPGRQPVLTRHGNGPGWYWLLDQPNFQCRLFEISAAKPQALA